jgi:reactive intermediate/imine deaminase
MLEPYFPAGARRSPFGLTPALKAGPVVYISGQVPTDPQTGELIGADIETQTRTALRNVTAVLEAAGASLRDVIKVNVFLTGGASLRAMDEAYREFFAEPYPARTTVTIAALGRPEFLIEIDAVAVLRS